MAIVYRNGRAYAYQSVRRNGRVTSEYQGSGSIALLRRSFETIVREQKDAERFHRQAEQESLQAAEQHLIDYFDRIEELVRDALLAAGYHQHKRQWRKRRVRPQEG
jgi:hypothetical protein